ncbi:MAG TPA: hypothetical protein VKZ63_09255, partial [Kofleriaceae bacterium]|nr:hypothetical protein [Kofleriaceae bacterium]
MEDLHRFVLIRPSEPVAEGAEGASDLTNGTSFQSSLSAAETQQHRRDLAASFLDGTASYRSVASVPRGAAYLALAHHYLGVRAREERPVASLLEEAAGVLAAADPSFTPPPGGDATALTQWFQSLVSAATWTDERTRLQDSILAIRESGLHTRELHRLSRVLQARALVEQLADPPAAAIRPGAIIRAALYLRAPAGPKRKTPLVEDDLAPEPDDLRIIRDRFRRMSRVAKELLDVPLTMVERITETREEVTETEGDPAEPGNDETVFASTTTSLRLGEAVAARLSQEAHDTLRDLNLDLASDRQALIDVVRSEQKKAALKLYQPRKRLLNGTALRKLELDGTTTLETLPSWIQWLQIAPQTTGNVSPVGLGDLMIVKQQLVRYEGGDVAHIENILQGEAREREHRRRQLTETTFVRESETETTDERETQTTSRYEMGVETSKQVEEEFGVTAGVTISASYGPTVSMEADTGFSYQNSVSEARNMAASQAKETVEKAATRVRQKVREQQVRKVVEEIEELNRHSFDASAATGHIVGVY